jgi:four helix bundle protein
VNNEKAKASSYKDLLVWQKAFASVKEVYILTGEFPAHEKYGLMSQMRRAAVSVPSNVAEGQARHSTREFILFVSHAEGSAAELETQLLIAVELGYCGNGKAHQLLNSVTEIRKMLGALRRSLFARC